MLKIKWTVRIKNDEEPQRMHTTPKLNEIIAKRESCVFWTCSERIKWFSFL